MSAQSPEILKDDIHPAAIWQQIQKYLLPYQQTAQQLHSSDCETPQLINNSPFSLKILWKCPQSLCSDSGISVSGTASVHHLCPHRRCYGTLYHCITLLWQHPESLTLVKKKKMDLKDKNACWITFTRVYLFCWHTWDGCLENMAWTPPSSTCH